MIGLRAETPGLEPNRVQEAAMAKTAFAAIMEDFFPALTEGLDASHKSLQRFDAPLIAGARARLDEMQGGLHMLVEALVKDVRKDPNVACLIPTVTRLEQMLRYMVRIEAAIAAKHSGQILFSDKAYKELGYLMERLRDIIVHTKDYVLTGSALGALHVIRTETVVEKAADDAATAHEDRLIEGLCLPVASGLFIEMLDCIKSIAWYAREIAETKCP